MTRARIWQTAALLVLGLLILYGLLRTVHPNQVAAAVGRASPWLVLVGMASGVGFILIRGWRWQLILAASAPKTSIADATAVTAVGFAVNSVSPFKLGEILRIALITPRSDIGVGEAGATVVLERVLDVLVLLVLAVATALASGGGSKGAGIWGGLALLSGVSLAFGVAAYIVVRHPAGSLRVAGVATGVLPHRLRAAALGLAESALKGFSLLRSPGRFALTIVVSLAVWIVPILGLIAYVRSVTPVLAPVTLFLALTLFVITQAVTVTPAAVGTYEGLFLLVLGAFGAGPATVLTAAAVVAHIGGVFISLLVGAAGALWLRFRPARLPVRFEGPAVSEHST